MVKGTVLATDFNENHGRTTYQSFSFGVLFLYCRSNQTKFPARFTRISVPDFLHAHMHMLMNSNHLKITKHFYS